MIGVYFSGTGNSKYCVEQFLQEMGNMNLAFSIESPEAVEQIKTHSEMVFCYPVQFSNLPKILKDFIIRNRALWHGKKIYIIATMGLFSGDGAGVSARLFKKYGASVTGGLHLKMPDSISDEKALKRTLEENRRLIANAGNKIKAAAECYKNGSPTQEGIGLLYQLAGLFGQRLYFYRKTSGYSDKLKINTERCIGCGKCVSLCPMGNIILKGGKAVPLNRCTMCYRCISKCPRQAVTLLGKRIAEQCCIDKYLNTHDL